MQDVNDLKNAVANHHKNKSSIDLGFLDELASSPSNKKLDDFDMNDLDKLLDLSPKGPPATAVQDTGSMKKTVLKPLSRKCK